MYVSVCVLERETGRRVPMRMHVYESVCPCTEGRVCPQGRRVPPGPPGERPRLAGGGVPCCSRCLQEGALFQDFCSQRELSHPLRFCTCGQDNP